MRMQMLAAKTARDLKHQMSSIKLLELPSACLVCLLRPHPQVSHKSERRVKLETTEDKQYTNITTSSTSTLDGCSARPRTCTFLVPSRVSRKAEHQWRIQTRHSHQVPLLVIVILVKGCKHRRKLMSTCMMPKYRSERRIMLLNSHACHYFAILSCIKQSKNSPSPRAFWRVRAQSCNCYSAIGALSVSK